MKAMHLKERLKESNVHVFERQAEGKQCILVGVRYRPPGMPALGVDRLKEYNAFEAEGKQCI